MSSDAPASPSSAPPAQMDLGSRLHHCVDSEHHSSRLPSQAQTDNADNSHHHANHPTDPSFFGLPPLSCDQPVRGVSALDRSIQGCFPSQQLRGPGYTGTTPPPLPDCPLSPTSRVPTASPDLDAVDGYGPTPGSPDQQREPSTSDLHPTARFARRKNSAYEIWAFIRAVETDEVVPAEQWPDDYDDHLTHRPDTTFVGCKLCTQFGTINGIKAWKVFKNGRQTSPTSTLRHHFDRQHHHVWDSERSRLGIPRQRPRRPALDWDGEPITREGIVKRVQAFTVNINQSIKLVESPNFRNLVLFLGQGNVTEDELPTRADFERERV